MHRPREEARVLRRALSCAVTALAHLMPMIFVAARRKAKGKKGGGRQGEREEKRGREGESDPFFFTPDKHIVRILVQITPHYPPPP